jgi:hypothetical protein
VGGGRKRVGGREGKERGKELVSRNSDRSGEMKEK